MEEIVASITKTLDRINKFPFEEVGTDARAAVQGVREAMENTKVLMKALNSDVRPRTLETLKQTQSTLVSLEKSFNTDSSLNQEAKRAMEELAAAARSIRLLVDYIERNPDAVIYGKGKDKQ